MAETAPDESTREQALTRDLADPLRGFRDRFQFSDPDLIYLDGNSLGRLPIATRARLRAAVDDEWGEALIRGWRHWTDLPRQAGAEIAGLLEAEPDEVIVSDSTSVNLYKLAAAALAARPDRHVIVTDDDNFPTDSYVLQGLAATSGRHLKTVKTDIDTGADLDVIRQAVDQDTALVSLSHVAYRSGAITDMAEVTSIAHQAGALILWDLCHSAGAVPVRLRSTDADLAVGCTYKYLNAGPGAPAFLYVRRDLQELLRQPIWGWFGQQAQFEMAPVYQPVDGIERFMVGTPSVLGCDAVLQGARLIAEAGVEASYAKGQALTSYAAQLAENWLERHGVRLASPTDPDRRGCHLTLHHPQAWQLCQALIAARVVPDFRSPERLRVGLAPIYTSFTDVHDGFRRLHEILESDAHLAFPTERSRVT